MADKYGIPAGGDSYPGRVKYYKNDRRRLKVREILEAVRRAGWSENEEALAVAIALAESNGHPFIYNTYKQGHFGLFQISRSAHSSFFAGGSEAWADPVQNARKAREIKKSQGWGAWEAYTNKRWHKFRNDVAEAMNDEYQGGLLEDLIKDPGAVLDGASDAVGEAVDGVIDSTGIGLAKDVWKAVTTPAFWMRIAYGTTGVVLIVGGLLLITKNTSAGKAVTATANKAVSALPAGRAATAVKGATK